MNNFKKIENFIKTVNESNTFIIRRALSKIKLLGSIKIIEGIDCKLISDTNLMLGTNYYIFKEGIVSVTGVVNFEDLGSNDPDYYPCYLEGISTKCKATLIIDLRKPSNPFIPGNLVEFKDKNPGSTGLSHESIYEYLGECTTKDKLFNWLPAVLYKNKSTGEIFIRERSDFYKKFNQVNSL